MKSVLISIQPKWVEKIASGEKTIEVRKSRPKLETPFKCYIYCTKAKEVVDIGKTFSWGKEVIGEFVCDRIIDIPYTKPFLYYGKKMYHSNKYSKEACLSYIELENYLSEKDGYGWHISDLVIYDKPKELSEFSTYAPEYTVKDGSKYSRVIVNPIKRPPQSWCYVEGE